MKFKSTYRLIYTLNRSEKELLIEVQLKQVEGKLKPNQNVYYGEAYINGKISTIIDLSHCVNAKYAAEKIGLEMKNDLKMKAIEEKLSFNIKSEEIK